MQKNKKITDSLTQQLSINDLENRLRYKYILLLLTEPFYLFINRAISGLLPASLPLAWLMVFSVLKD